jgi:hypothetical protein
MYEKAASQPEKIMLARLVPNRAVLPVYVATAFASAGLLFAVEPMISKMALPQLGGTPNVWNTCLFFFQATLLLGYSYAHALARRLDTKWQIGVHLTVLAGVSFVLPLSFSGEALPTDEVPVLWLLKRLAVTAGPPFFAISATAPLLQHWFSKIGQRGSRDPYFLYAASNLGSLCALLAYPLVIEPNLPLNRQSELWSEAFGIVALGLILCSIAYLGRGPIDSTDSPVNLTETETAIVPRERFRWIVLSFVPSSLLIGVTAHITTDVAATPLFWVVPLSIYLLTFVLAFARRPLLRHALMVRLLPTILVIFVVCGPLVRHLPGISLTLLLNLAAFFAIAMVCHGELAKERPSTNRLTEFYFCISLGGVLGGLFNALLAPVLFPNVWEFPLVFVLACLLMPRDTRYQKATLAYDLLFPAALLAFLVAKGTIPIPHWQPVFLAVALVAVNAIPAIFLMSLRKRPLRFALGIAAFFAAPAFETSPAQTIATYRSFFGVYRISSSDDGSARLLWHGTTVHGAESLIPGEETMPAGYYSRDGAFGRFFAALEGRGIRQVGVIGLGTAGLGCYAEPGQQWTFYEIDPLVERLARDEQYFHFLTHCGEKPRVVLGDARLSLAAARDGSFDILVIDAFSSDSIPTHLLTKEALALYYKKLTASGVLLFHISNRYLDLRPVVTALAYSSGAKARYLLSQPNKEKLSWRSFGAEVVVVGRPGDDLDFLPAEAGWLIPPPPPAFALWTDQRSDILRTIHWIRGKPRAVPQCVPCRNLGDAVSNQPGSQ